MPSNPYNYIAVSAVLTLLAFPVCGEELTVDKHQDTGVEVALTAERLASWVLESNPGLVALQAAAEAAVYRVDLAGSLDDPTLRYAVAPLTASADRSLNQQLEFSQKIPWAGTLAAREDVARYEADSADRDVDAFRLGVIAQAKSAFAEWRFVDEGIVIFEATRGLLEELLAITKTRYVAGRSRRQDVLQVEIEQVNLENRLLEIHRQRSIVQASINALLNRSPDTPIPPAIRRYEMIVLPAFEGLQVRALEQNPELGGLGAKVSASQGRAVLAEKAFYPDFQVAVGYNGLWDDTDKRPVLGVSINIPLHRNKYRSELGQAKADVLHARWSLVDQRSQLLSDLAHVHADIEQAQASMTLYEDQLVPLAGEYLQFALTDYQSGQGTFLSVIVAERRKLETRLALARVRADYLQRLAELERLIGMPVSELTKTGGTL